MSKLVHASRWLVLMLVAVALLMGSGCGSNGSKTGGPTPLASVNSKAWPIIVEISRNSDGTLAVTCNVDCVRRRGDIFWFHNMTAGTVTVLFKGTTPSGQNSGKKSPFEPDLTMGFDISSQDYSSPFLLNTEKGHFVFTYTVNDTVPGCPIVGMTGEPGVTVDD